MLGPVFNLDQFLTFKNYAFLFLFFLKPLFIVFSANLQILKKHKKEKNTICEHTCANCSCQNVPFFYIFHLGFSEFQMFGEMFLIGSQSSKNNKTPKQQKYKNSNNMKTRCNFKTKQDNNQKNKNKRTSCNKNKQNKNKSKNQNWHEKQEGRRENITRVGGTTDFSIRNRERKAKKNTKRRV